MKRSTDALQAGRESAIAGLTSAGGLTKDQIAQRQFAIEQQIYALEQQRAVATAAIRVEEDQIYTIQQGRLLTAQNAVIAAEEALQKDRTKMANELAINDQRRQSIEDQATALALAKVPAEEYQKELKKAQNNAEGTLKKILALNTKVTTTHYINTIYTSSGTKGITSMYGGKVMPMSMGGMVPKYMAVGGRIGSDTVPAMLTPGEFVMNKKATQQFGPLLSMLNESKYPSMIGSSGSAQVPINSVSTSMSDNSTAVYNYNLGFSINGSNGNVNDIARAVMREIKDVDSQRIRGQRR
jgi:hypothetical protein